jgi:hypothetical protein
MFVLCNLCNINYWAASTTNYIGQCLVVFKSGTVGTTAWMNNSMENSKGKKNKQWSLIQNLVILAQVQTANNFIFGGRDEHK